MKTNENMPEVDLAAALDRLQRAVVRLEQSGGGLFPGHSGSAQKESARQEAERQAREQEEIRRLDALRRENAALRDMVGVANRKLGDVIGRLNTILET